MYSPTPDNRRELGSQRSQPSRDVRLAQTAATQLGLLTRADVAQAGGDSHFVARRVRSGMYEPVAPGVFALAGSGATWARSVMAAVLSTGTGAVASHYTAAFMLGLIETRPDQIEVSTTKSFTADRPWIIHRRHNAPDVARASRRAIPTTSVIQTLIDCVAYGSDAGKLLDAAGRRYRTKLTTIQRFLEARAGKGRTGIRALLDEVECRLRWEAISESELESMFHRLLRDNGLPLPESQVVLRRSDGSPVSRVDNYFASAGAVVYLDGYRWHSDHGRFHKDRSQQNELASMGLRTFRYTIRHLEDTPEVVVDQIRDLTSIPYCNTGVRQASGAA
ncbi:MAG: hypothetical protein R2770_04085 [Acidimicrobiales bacterium]